ncbi:MAG: LuxR C-terminal-related transcriptional regulator [Nocardioides marinisabuli]|uniref:LuxR C-terminal-related transcriptional regulator n=1 Tax=Nocardioides marinisabuli TaxID=419476 RepID=UPI0032197A60
MGVGELERARAGFERGDWAAAHAGWVASAPGTLSVQDLTDLATAAELLGRHTEAVAALQDAFARSLEGGELPRAVHCAFRLAMTTAAHSQPALSAGWAARVEELLDTLDADAVEHGWVAMLRMFRALGAGAYDEAGACADRAAAVGRGHHDTDLVAMATCARGRFAMYAGRVPAGLALLDESMVRVVAGETSPVIAGHVYCTAIEGCQEVGDLARVAEWTAALERWCARQPGLLAFTGQCAVHRGQLLRLHGDWPGALAEFADAERRYRQVHALDAVGLASYERGEVLRLLGQHADAEAAFDRASDHGYEPQPGLALLWVARGRTGAARAAVGRLLTEAAGPVQRARLLGPAVDVLLACDDQGAARDLVDDLDRLAAEFGCAGLLATAAAAHGAVELAGGDPAGALPYLRKAYAAWVALDGPHEVARVRVQLARALRSMGDHDSARVELEAARRTFAALGAAPDLAQVGRLMAPEVLPAGLTGREAQVLRLVAAGRSNAQIADELVLSEKTVARHLSNIFTKLDVHSRTAAAAFAFEHDLM